MMYLGYLVLVAVVVLVTYLAIRAYDRVRRLVQFRDVASQTQTTYTEVCGAGRPRFRVLPEHSHG